MYFETLWSNYFDLISPADSDMLHDFNNMAKEKYNSLDSLIKWYWDIPFA